MSNIIMSFMFVRPAGTDDINHLPSSLTITRIRTRSMSSSSSSSVRTNSSHSDHFDYSATSVGEWGWGVVGKQVGSMDEEPQVRLL